MIDSCLSKVKRNVKYQRLWATDYNLRKIFKKKPRLLHFSGHGVRVVKKNPNDPDEDYLIIEKDDMAGVKLPVTALRNLLGKNSNIEVALVLSCQSEEIGRVFKSAGIKHVICIKRNYFIADTACIKFAQEFYSHLFEHDMSNV